jgi:signal transduction histidine kinase
VQDLPEAQALALFHICQEGLANVAKHARARHVEVSLWTSPDRALLEVRDDGRGFDPTKMQLNLGHGLQNIQTRARNAGGDVDFSSEPGDGTTILAWVPFSHNPPQVDEGSGETPPGTAQKFE